MSSALNRREWLITTGMAAGASTLLPSLLPALGTSPRVPGPLNGDYADALLQMEADATAARRAAGPVRLCYNENPFGMSPKAKEALLAGWGEHSQYDLPSLGALKQAFAKHVGVDPSNVLVTQGSSETLSIAAIAFGLHGGDVVTPWPTFEGLPSYAESIGSTVHRVPLDANLGHDFAAMDARITNATKLVFVCNPNNPTSTLASPLALRSFVSATQHRSVVLVDEAYHDFVDDPSYRSLTDLVLKGENVIISRTSSKVHGLAGLRVGFAIARPDIIERLQPFATGNANGLGMTAAAASLEDTAYQEFVKARNREGRTLLTSTLTAMGKRVAPSQTNFVFFQMGMPLAQFSSAVLAKGFRVGRPFPPYRDWCRVSIGTPEEMKRFAAVLPDALRA